MYWVLFSSLIWNEIEKNEHNYSHSETNAYELRSLLVNHLFTEVCSVKKNTVINIWIMYLKTGQQLKIVLFICHSFTAEFGNSDTFVKNRRQLTQSLGLLLLFRNKLCIKLNFDWNLISKNTDTAIDYHRWNLMSPLQLMNSRSIIKYV